MTTLLYQNRGIAVKESLIYPESDPDDILNRLTDTSKYTGSHKVRRMVVYSAACEQLSRDEPQCTILYQHRFDGDGKGLGKEGRCERLTVGLKLQFMATQGW